MELYYETCQELLQVYYELTGRRLEPTPSNVREAACLVIGRLRSLLRKEVVNG